MSKTVLHNSFILVLAVVAALIAPALFLGNRLGLDFVIFYFLAISAFFTFRYFTGDKIHLRNYLLISIASLFILCLIWRDSATLQALNIIALLIIAMIAYITIICKNLYDSPLLTWFKVPVRLLISLVVSPFKLVLESFLPQAFSSGFTPQVRSVLMGLLFAAPVLLVFGSLLISADDRFEHFIESIFIFDVTDILEQLFDSLLYLPFTSAFFLLTLMKDKRQEAIPQSSLADKLSMNGIQLCVVLGMLNLLFFTYIIIQSTYFFGGEQLISNNHGTTYSSYARKGFWELVWVAILALILLLFSGWLVRKESEQSQRYVKLFSLLLIAFVAILESSAAHRMYLYVKAYGLTELRFYSSVFMLFISSALILYSQILIKGQRNSFSFKLSCIALGFIFALNCINPNAIIASYNLSTTNKKVDAYYLNRLGYDAIEAIYTHATLQKGTQLCDIKHELVYKLNYSTQWYEWSYAKFNAEHIIANWNNQCGE